MKKLGVILIAVFLLSGIATAEIDSKLGSAGTEYQPERWDEAQIESFDGESKIEVSHLWFYSTRNQSVSYELYEGGSGSNILSGTVQHSGNGWEQFNVSNTVIQASNTPFYLAYTTGQGYKWNGGNYGTINGIKWKEKTDRYNAPPDPWMMGISYTYPNTAPVFNEFSSTPNNTDWKYNDSIDLSYNISDDKKVENVTISLYKDSVLQKQETYSYTSAEVNDSFADWYNLDQEGNYSLEFNATDNESSSTIKTVESEVVKIHPDVTVESPVSGIISESSVNLDTYANESIESWTYVLNGGSNQSFQPNVTLSDLPEGDNQITIYAEKSNGVLGSETRSFTVDTVAPQINSNISNEIVSQSSLSINLSGSDDSTTVSNLTYRKNDGGWTTVTSSQETITFSGDGNKSFDFYAVDEAGNNATMVEDYVVLDTTPPNFNSVPENQTVTYEEQWDGKNFGIDDVTSGVEDVVAESGDFKITSDTYLDRKKELAAGNYTTNVKATDKAGNSETVKYKLDVQKSDTNIDIVFRANGLEIINENYTMEEDDRINVSANINASKTGQLNDTNFDLFRNGSEVGSVKSGFVEAVYTGLDPGRYYFTSNFTGNENYTTSFRDPYVEVTEASSFTGGGGGGGGSEEDEGSNTLEFSTDKAVFSPGEQAESTFEILNYGTQEMTVDVSLEGSEKCSYFGIQEQKGEGFTNLDKYSDNGLYKLPSANGEAGTLEVSYIFDAPEDFENQSVTCMIQGDQSFENIGEFSLVAEKKKGFVERLTSGFEMFSSVDSGEPDPDDGSGQGSGFFQSIFGFFSGLF